MSKFYSMKKIRASNGDSAGRIDIYGEISAVEFWGDEKTPSQFIADLNALGPVSEIEIHIFSPGGDPFAALAIYAEIKRRPEKVNVYIDGIAASAATLILCAGDTVYMDETAMLMVHNPYQLIMFAGLDANAARELAAELDKIREPMITAYTKKSGKTRDEIIALMDGEAGAGTWLTAAEAIEFGLADEYTPEVKKPLEVAASIAPGVFSYKGNRVDVSMFDKAAEKTASIINIKSGGINMAKLRNNKAAGKKRTRAEIVFVEMVCPSCSGNVNMNPETGEVIPGNQSQAAPQEGETPASTLARRMPGNVRAVIYSVCCPHCGNDFVWDTDVNQDQGEGQQVTESVPLGKTAGDNAGSGQGAQAPAPASAPAPVASKGNPKAELAQASCPNCGGDFMYDTETTEQGADAAGTQGYVLTCPECSTQFIEPLVAASPVAIPEGTNAQAAYRMGVMAERNRMMALDEMAQAAPHAEAMISAAKRTGASIEAMSRNVIRSLAKNRGERGRDQFIQALNRDVEASGVNEMQIPQHHNKQAAFADSVFAGLNDR
jgi:ATP-dependent protease ClpP protease subunit/predicted RNA-binding Zn-ribbon protein involved in translation (DUF1610 family)